MARTTAVSFDADGIRITTGHRSRSAFTVERTLLLPADELDAFLSQDRAHEYLVAVNPEDAQFETITIPPVEAKLEATLIKTETARLHPELTPFSCGWQVIGDIPQEGRIVRKVACCLVPYHSLEPLLEPFVRHGKLIRQVIAAPVALASLVKATEPLDEPLLCAHDSGSSKLLFLLEDGAVTFSRSISSNERGWDVFDRQNVSMTMDYCFQALRVRPGRVLVLNPFTPLDENAPPPHLEHLALPAKLQVGLPPIVMQEYQVPFLLAGWPMPATANLLPESYQSAQLQQTVLQRSSQLFMLASIVLLLLICLQLFSLNNLTAAIAGLRNQEAQLAAIHQAHRQALAQRDQIQPLIEAVTSSLAAPDIPATLVALNGLKVPQVTLHSLTAKRTKDAVNLHLSGQVAASGFAASQER